MTILVTGATGTIGSALVGSLAQSGVSARAMTRAPEKHRFPQGIEAVRGDMSDIQSVRSALSGVSTLFLLNAVGPEELHQALTTLSLAREAGVTRVVYLSVMDAEKFVDVPHFAAKAAVETAIKRLGFSATILRANYFMQNDIDALPAIVAHKVYPMVIGSRGLSMVDVRDIVDAAAIELLRLDNRECARAVTSFNLVGPDVITADLATTIWSHELNEPVVYVGDDLAAAEQRMARSMPLAIAYDLCLMFAGFQAHGFAASNADLERLTKLLGRPPRTYEDFVRESLRR